ncbi:uncharacterized protein LOC111064515 isoform X2 [Nilaparvata lugens]|nr:uncharacterized protein LOC111064515 isoform X2 [Nilaparvata lugens]XP_039286536.1 uncharacterized protein LOC111064515 isoform X2 [Nilaparvata lugens]XP_039286538.1 uncharacterized protein LOC111064515 isoform X2 [Nilaparvata lugens]
MEEGKRMLDKTNLQDEIDFLYSMIREREKMLQSMDGFRKNTQQTSAMTLNSTKISGSGSIPATMTNSVDSSVKCPSDYFIKSVISESKSQPSFKTSERVIRNSTAATETEQSSSISTSTTPANNIFINPKFQKSSFLNKLNVESSNEESKNNDNKFRNEMPSISSQCNKTKIGIHVNPNFRSKITQSSVPQKVPETSSCQQNLNSKIGNSDESIPSLTVDSTKLMKKSVCIVEKPKTLYINPKLVQKESTSSTSKMCGNDINYRSNEVPMMHSSVKQPLTSKNSQDQKRFANFPNVKPNFENASCLKNVVPFNNRNMMMNRGRRYAWTPKPNSRLTYPNYTLSNMQHHSNKFINGKVPVQKNRVWKKPVESGTSEEALNRQADSIPTDKPKIMNSSKQIALSLVCQEPVPCTSRTVVSKETLKSTDILGLGESSVVIGMNSPDLRNEFHKNINQPTTSITTLVAISPREVIMKHEGSPQDSNPQQTVVNRKTLKGIESQTQKYNRSNLVTKIDSLKIKFNKISKFYLNVKQQQASENVKVSSCHRQPATTVASQPNFVAGQKHRAFNSRAGGLQSTSNLISVNRNKLIGEQSSNCRPALRRSQSRTQLAARNNRIVGRFHNSMNLALNRNSLIRDRLRMRRHFNPNFQSYNGFRIKYRNFNTNNRRHILPRNSHFRKQPAPHVSGEFKSSPRKRMKSITIEGVKYHSSCNKLQRKLSLKDMRANQKQLVSVRGEKFEVGNGGRTLKRIGEGPARLNKVYVDGVAFIRSKENNSTMCRTNTQNVHQKLRQAKQRSIAQLTKKMRKNNEPCPIYHRFGKCSGKENGTCYRVHDRKNVAICRKFLNGICHNKDCLLFHDIVATKMPTCRHFLAGICTRENCQYLHVKLNNSAPICIKFLQGYCELAEKCKNRHIEICPEFEELAKCSKGKCCPYPHPKNYHRSKLISFQTNKRRTRKSDKIVMPEELENYDEQLGERSEPDVGALTNRYYMAYDDGNRMAEESSNSDNWAAVDSASHSGTSWLKSRPKLGHLGGFIPFEKKQ